MPETEYIETRPQPKFTLLTFGQYFKLNHDLSIAKGWQLGQDTERSFEMNPVAAKINITYDEEGVETGYDIAFVMQLSSEIQENYPEIIEGLELVIDYIPADEHITEIIATGLNTEIIDWVLQHYVRVGVKEDGLVIWLEEQARSQLSDEAINQLNGLGIIIITIDA